MRVTFQSVFATTTIKNVWRGICTNYIPYCNDNQKWVFSSCKPLVNRVNHITPIFDFQLTFHLYQFSNTTFVNIKQTFFGTICVLHFSTIPPLPTNKRRLNQSINRNRLLPLLQLIFNPTYRRRTQCSLSNSQSIVHFNYHQHYFGNSPFRNRILTYQYWNVFRQTLRGEHEPHGNASRILHKGFKFSIYLFIYWKPHGQRSPLVVKTNNIYSTHPPLDFEVFSAPGALGTANGVGGLCFVAVSSKLPRRSFCNKIDISFSKIHHFLCVLLYAIKLPSDLYLHNHFRQPNCVLTENLDDFDGPRETTTDNGFGVCVFFLFLIENSFYKNNFSIGTRWS